MIWRRALTPRQHRQLWYIPLLGFSMGLMFVRLLLLARLLGVASFGDLNAGLLVSGTFCMLGCLGLQSMLQRDLPIMMVHRRERVGLVLIGQCLILAAVCTVLGLLVAAGGLPVAGMSPALVAVGVLHGFSQQVFVIATVESRSRGEPVRFALQNLVRALGALAAGLIVAKLTDSAMWCLVAEAAVSLTLSQHILLAVFRRAGMRIRIAWRLAMKRLRHLQWRSAIALLAVGTLGFVLVNADRWLAASLMDARQFAQYSFAWIVLMISQSLQAIINASAYPMLARRFAATGRATAFRLAARASLALLAAGAVLAVPAWLVLRASVSRWYPAYEPAQILLPLFLAIAVLRTSDFWSSFMLIVGLEVRLLWLNLAAGLTATGLWLGLHQDGPGNALISAGLLAAMLTVSNYVVIIAASWHAARK